MAQVCNNTDMSKGTHFGFTRVSSNKKTGPIPVTMSARSTCPDSCPFKGGMCYGEVGPVRIHWDRVSRGTAGTEWDELLVKVMSIPRGSLWRHNQVGDLPGEGDALDCVALGELVQANRGRKGFTYTHKPLTTAEERWAVRRANELGFTVNLSGNDMAHADKLCDMDMGPVVCVLPKDTDAKAVKTPAGRTVMVCPATYRDGVTCASCGICQKADRSFIVGFPAHGGRAKLYDGLLQQVA